MDETFRHTEQDSNYRHLEKMSVSDLLLNMNLEDQKVALAIRQVLPSIELCVEAIVRQLRDGGRLFYIGAGTSGRLGILDAAECPPTFGVDYDLVIGLIAGGDEAIRRAVEFAEDSNTQAWLDLTSYGVDPTDFVVGIAASGTTPYVLHGLEACNQRGIPTACITANPGSPIGKLAQFPIEVAVGPEFVTGSTRLKAGTAQKMILNMISTCTMIQLGRVMDNKMVDMQLTNEKLIERGIKIIMQKTGFDRSQAQSLLMRFGSVREALRHFR